MAFLYVFIKLHVILFNEVLNNKFPKTNPAVPSSLLAPESWCHCHWISTPLEVASTISRDIDTGMSCLLVETVVHGYHVYKVLWEPRVGETFIALHEINSK